MKRSYLIAAFVIITVGALPSAFGRPPPGKSTKVPYRTYNMTASMSFSSDTYALIVDAASFDSLTGQPRGALNVSWFAYPFVWFVNCSGPAYASVISVNKNSGAVAIEAKIDTSSPDCYVDGDSPPKVLVVDLIGKSDGNFRASQSGVVKSTESGVNYKMNFQCDFFYTETFSGTVGDFPGVTLTGSADACFHTNRQRTR